MIHPDRLIIFKTETANSADKHVNSQDLSLSIYIYIYIYIYMYMYMYTYKYTHTIV